MLGVGSSTSQRHHNTNALFMTPEYNLLIDAGLTAPSALLRLEIDPTEIDGVLITHLHPDHVNGLQFIAQSCLESVTPHKLDLYGEEKLLQDLWDQVLRGNMEFAYDGKKSFDDFFNLKPMQNNTPIQIPGYQIEVMKTPHVPQKASYSVFINDEILYTGDVRFDQKLIDYALNEKKCKLILHDCTLIDQNPTHAYIDDLLQLPRNIQEKIYLMHYEENVDDFIGKTGNMEFLEGKMPYTYRHGELHLK
jgi:ribonuclease BN (tRNA processing enzyme)